MAKHHHANTAGRSANGLPGQQPDTQPTKDVTAAQGKGHKESLGFPSDADSTSTQSPSNPVTPQENPSPNHTSQGNTVRPRHSHTLTPPPSQGNTKRPRHSHSLTSPPSQGNTKRPRRSHPLTPPAVQGKPKSHCRPYAPVIPPGIPWEQFRTSYNKARAGRRTFERDFPRYNRALNKAQRQSRKRPENQGRDYIPVYLSDSSVTPGNSTRESSLEPIDSEDLFGTTVQPVEFNPLTSSQSLRAPNNTPEPKPCRKKLAQA